MTGNRFEINKIQEIKSIMLNWAKVPTEFIDNYVNSVCAYYYRYLFNHGITPQLQSINQMNG